MTLQEQLKQALADVDAARGAVDVANQTLATAHVRASALQASVDAEQARTGKLDSLNAYFASQDTLTRQQVAAANEDAALRQQAVRDSLVAKAAKAAAAVEAAPPGKKAAAQAAAAQAAEAAAGVAKG